MKKFLALFLVLASLMAVSQPQRKVKHVILIRNNITCAVKRITENSEISATLASGQVISGRVAGIHADTIFFIDSYIRVPEIKKLVFNNVPEMPAMPGPFPHPNRRVEFAYVAGSSAQQIICPPDSVYKSKWLYQLYVKGLIYQAKNARNRERSPLRETPNPLIANKVIPVDSSSMDSDTSNLLNNVKVLSSKAPAKHYYNFLKWNVTKVAHLEIALSYERLIAKNLTWETELSAIFGVQSADAYYQIPQPIYNYNGFSITTYPKYYVISPTAYLGMVFMYRNLWATGIRTDWPDRENSGNGQLQDQYRNDFGLSVRIGIMKRYGNFVVDYYFGGGVKYIMLHQLIYGYYLYHDSKTMQWYHEDHSPDVYDRVLLGLVINLGIKIGFAF
jgi:hypothetical protein